MHVEMRAGADGCYQPHVTKGSKPALSLAAQDTEWGEMKEAWGMSFNSYVSRGRLLCEELHASGNVLAHADLPLSRPTVLHKPKYIVSTRHVGRDSPVRRPGQQLAGGTHTQVR